MKKAYYIVLAAFSAILLLTAANRSTFHPYGFENGTPAIKSISALAFGP